MAERFEPKRRVYKTSAPDWVVAASRAEAMALCGAYYEAPPEDLGDEADDYEALDPSTVVSVTGMTEDDVLARLDGLAIAGANMRAVTVSRSADGSDFMRTGYLGQYKLSASASEWAKLPPQFLCTVDY